MSKINKLCPNCGSDHLIGNTEVVWSMEDQKWEILDKNYVENIKCHECNYSNNNVNVYHVMVQESVEETEKKAKH